MIICGICGAMTVVLWISMRQKLSKERKKMLMILLLASGLGLLTGVPTCGARETEVSLTRNQSGDGEYEQTLELYVEGDEEPVTYDVVVPEQLLTEEEMRILLQAAADEIAGEFLGENESVDYVEQGVTIRDEYQEGKVLATWSFDNYDVMDFQGNVITREIPEEGILIKASVRLLCGELERREEFYFRVFSENIGEEEKVFYEIEQILKKEGELAGTQYYQLPEKVAGKTLIWKRQKEHTQEKILLLGIVIACMLPLVDYSRRKEREEKRSLSLLLEYPNMVSKLALLLRAGMTLKAAFFKIANAYEEKKKAHVLSESPTYEEMLITCREIENGVGESRAYERFGERCGAKYRRLGNLLAQKVRKGNTTLASMLEEEAGRAYEERKTLARRYGEQATTKLLFPMVLMLGLVMIVLLVPALISFQL